jgi:large subunit ribosomal protein L31
MQTEVHPKYFPTAKVTCACGRTFIVGSTKESIKVEICSECHPFYSGNEKLMDTAGRVEKFKARTAKASSVKRAAAKKSK